MNRLSVVFLTVILFLMSSLQAVYSGSVFYFPETQTKNITEIKTVFKSYLATQGNYPFQVIDNPETFFEEVILKKGNVFLLSAQQYGRLRQKKLPLETALTGVSKGSTLLVAKKEITDISVLKEETIIAAVGTESYTRNLLRQLLGEKNQALVEHIKILLVPKEIDALLSVGFGVATAAISNKNSLDKLAAINPNQFQQLHTLISSDNNYLQLIAATLNKPNAEEIQLLQSLSTMKATESGKKALELLDLTDWKPLY